MKITRLTLAGFGPYLGEQHVDFERFGDDGIFLITGKTGAGKSSILDAICYALYNAVPRYDGTQPVLRSDHCGIDDPTFVELEFTVNGTDYRVRRTPEYQRPKRRGNGTTPQAATAELYVRVGDAWEGRASRAVDVAHALDRVLGLSKDQFLQVILLAQNRFQKFLRANNDERQAVLRTLFGTRRFEQIETSLAERKRLLEGRLASASAALASQAALAASLMQLEEVPAGADLDWLNAGLAELEGALVIATSHAATTDAAAREADAAYRTLGTARTQQQRRDAAASTLVTLDAERVAVDADRSALNSAVRAATVWPQVVARRAAAAAAERAAVVESEARDAYADFGDEAATGDTLTTTIDETTRELGTVESVAAEEGRLAALESEIAQTIDRVASCSAAVTEATARIDALPVHIDADTRRFLDAQVRASAENTAIERAERVGTALAAATSAVTLDRKHTAALVAEKAASGALTAATTRLDTMLERRLSGHAAELARDLVEDEPCGVCGSPSHPAPAVWDGTPVTEADIDAARAELDERSVAMAGAHDTAQKLRTRLVEERTRSDNKSVVQLESELMAAESALANAESARVEVARREEGLARLRRELETAKAGLDALRTAKENASTHLTEQQSARTAILERVGAARGEFASVTARAAHLRAHLDAATTLATAIGETLARATAATDAESALAAQFTEHDFADESAVEAARRSKADIASLESRIRQHEQAVATARATLAEAELADLPSDPIETDAAREASELARDARDAARDARSSLAERTEQLRAVVTSARREHAASADLQEEFAHLRGLASAVQGHEPNTRRMRLETYVLAAQLEEIVTAANARLGSMTHGRFALEHDDGVQFRNARSGLGLSILDQHTGRSRATSSLSGGETFLASLALALGLAEVVQNQAGGITLDTLFIDEGFGSLDSETLETAMSTLDGLRAGGRTIGLISHVDTMKEQIPAKLRIRVTDRGHSEIEESYELSA